MSTLTAATIRLAADAAVFDAPLDVNRRATPQFWRGNDLQFAIGVFYNGAVQSVANLASITLEIRNLGADGGAPDPSTTPLMAQTVNSSALDNSLTTDTWNDGSKQHALISFAADQTGIPHGPKWLSLFVLTQDSPGRVITLAAGPIRVLEDGSGLATTPPSVEDIYYTATQSDARFALIGSGGGGSGPALSGGNPLMDGTASAGSSTSCSRADHVHPSDTTRAPLASPAFTGSPTAPSVSSASDSSTKIATTAFVQAAISAAGGGGGGGAAAWGGIIGTLSAQSDLNTALGLLAPLASPTFSGTVNDVGHITTKANITTTSTDGMVLTNPTAATSSVQQWSPRLRLTGQGWKSSVSQTCDWVIENQTVAGSLTPASNLVMSNQIGGAGYAARLTLDETGLVTVSSLNLTNPLGVAFGGTGLVSYGTGNMLYASGTTTLSKLIIGSTGQVLTVSGGGLPTWATPSNGGTASHQAISAFSAAGNDDATLGATDILHTVAATASAGSGAYTRTITLQTTNASAGDVTLFRLALPASTNPTVEIHNATSGGTLLTSFSGGASAQNVGAVYEYDGSQWNQVGQFFGFGTSIDPGNFSALTIPGSLYVNSTTGDTYFVNSGDNAAQTAGVNNSAVISLQNTNNSEGASAFVVIDYQGYQVGACGYMNPGITYPYGDYFFIAATMRYDPTKDGGSTGGVTGSTNEKPKGFMISQEGNYTYDGSTYGFTTGFPLLAFDPNMRFSMGQPDSHRYLSGPQLNSVACEWDFSGKTNSLFTMINLFSGTDESGNAIGIAAMTAGATAGGVPSGFPDSGGSLNSTGTGGLAIMASASGAPIMFLVSGYNSSNEALRIDGSKNLIFSNVITSAPGATLANSQYQIGVEDSSGTATFFVRYKDASGTVKNGTISLT